MSYDPIDFVNLPSKDTPVSAENLNHMQQGILLGVDRSRIVYEAWKDGSLKGDQGPAGPTGLEGPRGPEGPRGMEGPQGPQGPEGSIGPQGNDGKNFEVDGWVNNVAELPSVELNSGKTYGTRKFGHLHHSDGLTWIDWGEFTGVQGEMGPIGPRGADGQRGETGPEGPIGPEGPAGKDGVFDVENITPSQIADLYFKLYQHADNHRWHYKTNLVANKVCLVPLGDLNLNLEFKYYGTTMMTYRVIPVDTSKPSTYYIKRLANYDLVALEGTASSGYVAQPVTASGFVLDGSAYFAGREDIKISIYDPFNDFWYTINIFGSGTANNILIDVEKRAVQGRIVVNAT